MSTATIETIATAIAEQAPFYPSYIAEVLAGHEEAEFFEEMERLAADESASTEVLDALADYCSARVDSDVQDDPHYVIGICARENLAAR